MKETNFEAKASLSISTKEAKKAPTQLEGLSESEQLNTKKMQIELQR